MRHNVRFGSSRKCRPASWPDQEQVGREIGRYFDFVAFRGVCTSTGSDRSGRSCGSLMFHPIVAYGLPAVLLRIRSCVNSFRRTVCRIFLAVDRCQMRRISIEIRSPDSKLLLVCIDPFPEAFGGGQPLRPCPTFDAHDIGRKPVAIAAAKAPPVVRSVRCRP